MPERLTQIMGSSFYPGAGTWVMKMADKQELRLEREPGNKYDANAISVWIHGQQLGHISRQLAARWAADIDAGLMPMPKCYKAGRGDARIRLVYEGPEL